jgi:O-6-methylguanine DNA methyltransferase
MSMMTLKQVPLMKKAACCLFETPIGACGIAWRESSDSGSPAVVTAVQLPEATPQATKSRIARKSGASNPATPPPEIAAIIEKIRKHLQGETQDFRGVALDLENVDPFFRQIYEAARQIPPGQTRTYGEIAKAVGQPAAAQEVGQAMAKNPVPIIVPCHRVAAAGGKLGGFSASGGPATKAKLLAIEGAPVNLPLFS